MEAEIFSILKYEKIGSLREELLLRGKAQKMYKYEKLEVQAKMTGGIYDAPAITKEGPSVTEDPLLPFVEALARAADQRKGRSIAAFHVAPLTDVASFVIAACGRSRPQCDAVAAAVVDDAKELFDRVPNHVEGGADGGWTCIDFGDVIVNVMTPSSREFYSIDEIWKNAERVDLSEVVSPEGPDDLLDDEDLFDEDDDLEDFWDAPNAPDAW